MAASAYLAAAIASVLPALRASGWSGVQVWLLVVDVALLGFLMVLMNKDARKWLIIAGSLQTISVLAHLARLLDVRLDPVGYALMEGFSSYPMVILLAVATWNSWLRSSREGA